MQDIISYLYIIPAALIAIVFHETSHGLMSYLLGDPTPKEQGRLTLNPSKHLDLFGTLCLVFLGFGWAKPVRVDPRYYKNHKWGMAFVALAGPLANFIIAMFGGLMYAILLKFSSFTGISEMLAEFSMYLVMINVGLGIFNLIPIPPLDGSKIIGAFLPESAYYQYMKYQKYGMIFVLGLLVLLNFLQAMGYPSLFDKVLTDAFYFVIEFWLKIFF